MTTSKVVLAYSGGLDTSAIVPWLIEHYHCEVHCVVADVGQGADELVGVEDKAARSGAASCIIADLKDIFVTEFIYPTLKSGAIYEGHYLLGTSMARPAIARALVDRALQINADAISHGCTGKGNDQVRFEHAVYALAPHLSIIAPWREWSMQGRSDLLAYVQQKNIPVQASAEKIYSRDRNLWHISHEGGVLEDPWNAPPEDVWMLTRSIADAPDQPEDITIFFDQAIPTAVDHNTFTPAALIEHLNERAGIHSVGRIDIVENRVVGMKSRGCYETPAGTLLVAALESLCELVLDREARRLRDELALNLSHVVYEGKWFNNAAREALFAAIDALMHRATGEVVLRMHKGSAMPIQRRSPHSLYDAEMASFEAEQVYKQADAEGFIRLFSLPQRIAAAKQLAPNAPQEQH